MDPSVVVLILTGIFAVLGFGFIIAAFLISENKLSKQNGNTGHAGNNDGTTGATGNPNFICSGSGTKPQAKAPRYVRVSPKSTCSNPISTKISSFSTIQHPVWKTYRTRALTDIISPNHWLGNVMHGTENIFNVYPYYGKVENDGFRFFWPGTSTLSQDCADTNTCPSGYADLFLDVDPGIGIKISSWDGSSVSCDILDVDALVGTVAWQYRNTTTSRIGSITIPLAKGSPFITAELNDIGTSLECNFSVSLIPSSDKLTYTINNADGSDGYLLFLPQPITVTLSNDVIYLPRFAGAIRIAYFSSTDIITILSNHKVVYPIESTISTFVTGDTGAFNIDTTFQWTTRNMYSSTTDTELLMIALPHHNIINTIYESSLIDYSVIGPFRFIIGSDNQWIIADAVANYPFAYPPVNDGSGGTGSDSLLLVWTTEMENVIRSPPAETVNWCKWLGSVAILLLIGQMLNQNINNELTVFIDQLSRIQLRNGAISNSNVIVYDTTWGGVIANLGLDNCIGNSDGGNAYYESHVGQFGYLVFAYAVGGYLDNTFIQHNKETALLFARDIANPYQSDNSFPLWRNKDWYFGYSLSSGLAPHQSRGKDASNIGETILGYYGTYLLASIIKDQSELINWSLAMLANEISAAQFYFQYNNKIDVNSAFVQGTITNRGDTYYEYTVDNGNILFPERNASIMVPIVKPVSLISFDYINSTWAEFTQYWMTSAVARETIEPESLAYGLTLLSVNSSNRSQIIEQIVNNRSIFLPYGSTWSSVLYWVLNQ
ncbi:Glycosyl hydrolase family 81 [uncultured virus]|nr:Glycosyl hydrolase family 81 [uncultured virus]